MRVREIDWISICHKGSRKFCFRHWGMELTLKDTFIPSIYSPPLLRFSILRYRISFVLHNCLCGLIWESLTSPEWSGKATWVCKEFSLKPSGFLYNDEHYILLHTCWSLQKQFRIFLYPPTQHDQSWTLFIKRAKNIAIYKYLNLKSSISLSLQC